MRFGWAYPSENLIILLLSGNRVLNTKLTMKKETPEERATRKAIFIAKASAHIDTPEIRKEAEEMWENANKE